MLPGPTLAPDSLRTLSVRDIVADPSHPGRVYVVEANDYLVYQNDLYGLYAPMIVFAYSNDYGQTWEDQFQVGNETTNLASLPPGFERHVPVDPERRRQWQRFSVRLEPATRPGGPQRTWPCRASPSTPRARSP